MADTPGDRADADRAGRIRRADLAPQDGPVPHSHRSSRGLIGHQHELWPPPGWTHAGLADHMRRHRRACALLAAVTPDPGYINPALMRARVVDVAPFVGRTHPDATTARDRERAQFGRNLAEAADALRTATDRVVELVGDTDTGVIPRQDAAS